MGVSPATTRCPHFFIFKIGGGSNRWGRGVLLRLKWRPLPRLFFVGGGVLFTRWGTGHSSVVLPSYPSSHSTFTAQFAHRSASPDVNLLPHLLQMYISQHPLQPAQEQSMSPVLSIHPDVSFVGILDAFTYW